MTKNIDQTDRQILARLQRDGTRSVESLAEEINLSRNACWRRVKRLEAEGILRKRVALVDPEALKLDLVAIVMVKTNSHDLQWLNRFKDAVSSMPEIVGAHRMSGEIDYILKVRLTDMKAYDHFYQRLIGKVEISEVSACFVMEDIIDTTELPV